MSVESIYAPFADMVEDFLAKARMASDKIATMSPDQKGAFLVSMDEYIEEMAEEVVEIAKSSGDEDFSFSTMANDLNRIFRKVSGETCRRLHSSLSVQGQRKRPRSTTRFSPTR